jgi:hypothetical protein
MAQPTTELGVQRRVFCLTAYLGHPKSLWYRRWTLQGPDVSANTQHKVLRTQRTLYSCMSFPFLYRAS